MSGVDSGVLLYEKTKSMPSTHFALNPKLTHFVGLENFSTIFKDDLFTTAFGITVKFVLIIVPLLWFEEYEGTGSGNQEEGGLGNRYSGTFGIPLSETEESFRRSAAESGIGTCNCQGSEAVSMDEPLSNLDAKLRVSMRSEISKLHRQLGSTTIYVTHDQVEAMAMADRIVIMKDGVIQQVGKPMDLYEHPANKFVAGFIGSPQMNFYEVKVAGYTMTFSDGSKMQLPESVVTRLNGRQGTLVLGIRGEDIKLDPQNLDLYKDNIMSATVDSVEVMGNENNLYFNFGGTASVARVSKYEISKPGDTIDFAFVPSRMHFFDTQTEESLF